VIAVMLLSSKSKQGNREFVNEIGMMFCWRKPINAWVRVHAEQLHVLVKRSENHGLRCEFNHLYFFI
jgi:hypothetical protein